jgi:hypothetical protein
MQEADRKRLFWWIGFAIVFFWMLFGMARQFEVMEFARKCPTSPDPATGHIYPRNLHGVVYLTEEQSRLERSVDGPPSIGGVAFLLVLAVLGKVFRDELE